MKIAFIWWFDQASGIFQNWRDGLRAAMEEIEKKHEIGWYLDKTMPDPGDSDFLLFWSSSNEDYFNELDKFKERKGLCLTTDPRNIENLKKLDVVFVESQPIYDQCEMHGIRTIKAFGTDSDFFKPKDVKKDIEYFYPATFSPWKRQDEIAHLGEKLLCVGTIQPDGGKQYTACEEAGVKLEPGYFPAEKIRDYYQRAKNVTIPAIHGSERTVLEAMSTNILPTVTNSINHQARSFLYEYEASGCKTPREFILQNYTHKQYAKSLLKGIENA